MRKFLKDNGYKIKSTKKYIIAEGDIPICLVAHLDTVGKNPPKHIFYDNTQHVMWSPELLGADDRAGVYAIIDIINDGYRPHVIFTTDEEQGALGAQAVVTRYPDCPLENLKAIFQLDRRGQNDCVFYDCDNPDFENYVESFGFKTAYGSFSDISVLAPSWKVAAANLSIGYFNEHSETEHLFCDYMEETIGKVKKILDAGGNMLSYAYIPVENSYNPWIWGQTVQVPERCVCCGLPLSENNAVEIRDYGYAPYHVCEDCFQAYWEHYNKK